MSRPPRGQGSRLNWAVPENFPDDLMRLKKGMRRPVIVDLRNIYLPEEMARHGFTYESIGRSPASTAARMVRHLSSVG